MLKLDLGPELEDLCADELAVAIVGMFTMGRDDLAVERCQDGEIREAGMGQETTQEKPFI